MSQYRALLCDLDGTLVNSEPVHCRAWLEVLSVQYGLTYDEKWFEQWIGTTERKVANHVVKHHQLSDSPQSLIDAKQRVYLGLMKGKSHLFDGVWDQLELIAHEYPVAIATNSSRSDTEVVIPQNGLDQITEIVVTATDVQNVKPAPDIYLLAADKLGIPASQCIAIEDSQAGGQAAIAAGCYLIALHNSVPNAHYYAQSSFDALKRAREILQKSL